MRERKCIKFRVDMYDDTKFKIIDRMEKRDLINQDKIYKVKNFMKYQNIRRSKKNSKSR